MKITTLKIKLFGHTQVMFRVCSLAGDVLQVFTTRDEAQAWLDAQ